MMIPPEELKPALKTAIAATGDGSQMALGAILLEFPVGELRITATNGHALVHFAFEVAHAMPVGSVFKLWKKDAAKLVKEMPNDQDISLVIYDNTLLVMSGVATLQFEEAYPNGSFPDYASAFSLCDGAAPAPASIDIGLLVAIFTPMRALLKDSNRVEFSTYGVDKPLVISPAEYKHNKCLRRIKALIMPPRVDK